MATTSDIRNGAVILHKHKRMKVIEFQHVKPGKGGAFVRTKLKDIQSGKIFDETFNAGRKLEFIRVEAKTMQYLYEDGEMVVFMDNENFEQLNIPTESVGKGKNFLIGGMSVDLLFDGTEVLDVRLPSHIVLEVTKTEPGFRGNTAQGATKPATVETGYTLNVPLFIDEGDRLKIDTRTGDYVERSKE
ncbi:MAG: elongation factor P [Candidatus Marinimicrobia bacterium]|jgi:elongation factor P|nr:elongation factor P [Candidatus Neomarinimicrobiota bacterium]MBT3945980.1 elongation factor P [Candidatus Neomarinimicrobiota bacterium]MBT4154882.1 elongation factor P [Candidatus Neomarinimicrobiota bacterium]MBT4554598.1 elongation factor P [Candidatus Neomarinimicrobiota bacterium]MBT4753564.1 elongation factor P [Candidatus Neomarinimicrobiota bacterium]|tara:strand:+ start:43215 stop:43778 length:564 start_codon:yes stop_codon:yes gene_type:complete